MFTLTGKIIHGKRNGSTVNMPTANLETEATQTLPELGVYASRVYINNRSFIGVTNVGYRPTVDDEKRVTVETFIIGCEGDLYGDYITLDLIFYLRPTRKMHSLQEVKEQVEQDCIRAKTLLADENSKK